MASEDPANADATNVEDASPASPGAAVNESSATYDDDEFEASPGTSPNATLTRPPLDAVPDSPTAGDAPDSPTAADATPDSPTAADATPDSPTAADATPDSPTAADATPDSPTAADATPDSPTAGAAPDSPTAADAAPDSPVAAPPAAAEPAVGEAGGATTAAAQEPAPAVEPPVGEATAPEPSAHVEPAAAKPATPEAEPASAAAETEPTAAAPDAAPAPTAAEAAQAPPVAEAAPAPAAAETAPSPAAAEAAPAPAATEAAPAPAAAEADVAPAAAEADPVPVATEAAPAGAPAEDMEDEDAGVPEELQEDALDEAMNATQGEQHPTSPAPGSEKSMSRMSPKSKSMSALGSYADLKKKTSFANVGTEGVKKDGTYMIHFSNFKTGPKFSIGTRTGGAFGKSTEGPAPGSYNLVNEEKSKYTAQPRFSFGGCARFGLGQSPTKKAPGPGAYNPKDPTLHMEAKVGFGSGSRSKLVVSAQHNPGPGAYEARSTVGSGRMFTAGGRHGTSINRSRSQPGPGAYTPNDGLAFSTPPKCGFGTSTRTDFAARNRASCMPGPGTYEMQNFRSTGSDAPKYSATSRRRVYDLNSYVTPGPGTYNSHVTSFGY